MSPALDFRVAIPARYASTRLPGKPLLRIAGEPMIVHVARRALDAGAREVVVATDDSRIVDALGVLGLTVCMTDPALVSGTDRLAACAAQLGWPADAVVVNLQGDEPLAPPAAIRAVAQALVEGNCEIATLAVALHSSAELFDPNCVKLVRDAQGRALYFSRAPIPWHRDAFAEDRTRLPVPNSCPNPGPNPWLRHIGMYAYRVAQLQAFAAMPPGALERIESLEQLRVLEAGWRIAVAVSPVPVPAGVDTADDLERVRALIEAS